ncbi:MAG TPA: hydroxymethylbilane synthase [Bacteroidota bacterium]
MSPATVRIGTRGSDLALWQAHWVRRALEQLHPGLMVSLQTIKTTGDKILDAPLSKIGDKGLFTREIERALLEGSIDLAVHSLKDLPTELPDGLTIGAVTEREDPRDVFVPHPAGDLRTLAGQPSGARIATGSLRRQCQLHHLRPDITIVDIRGNLATRMRKLAGSDWQGMLLARAGVVRLGWEDKIGEVIPAEVILPAVGQGALGVEIRADDERTARLVEGLTHRPTRQATDAERALLRRLQGGCQVPIGTYGRLEPDGRLILDAVVGSLDGKTVVRGQCRGNPDEAERLGTRLAEQLITDGAGPILQEIRGLARDAYPLAP